MKKILILILSICNSIVFAQVQQKINLPIAKFKAGDDAAWKTASFDDSQWTQIKTGSTWELQEHDKYDGFAWYRFHFKLPSTLKNNSYLKKTLRIMLGQIDDVDETYLNGQLIGQTGGFPDSKAGYNTSWSVVRNYTLNATSDLLLWDKENVLAIRVYDGGGNGGITDVPFIAMLDLIDGLTIDNGSAFNIKGKQVSKNIRVNNSFDITVKGSLLIKVEDIKNHKLLKTVHQQLVLAPKSGKTVPVQVINQEGTAVTYSFTEEITHKSITANDIIPYILTPPAAPTPRINGAKVFGVRPGSPFLYKIAATGKAPLSYSVDQLPAGLTLDKLTGIISGKIANKGDYHLTFRVTNSLGVAERAFTIKSGDQLSLTPPMGWNSWNCWGLSVSEARVKSSAQAMIDKGLIDHGWMYINIDDGWEAPQRNANGELLSNEKFPDMKKLGDDLHQKGLKFGIYSSPGPKTCGGFLGSYQHELQDASSYNNWGVDYLKYDWCSYGDIVPNDTTLAAYQKPYKVMQTSLQQQPRDIVYSLCQYGWKDVWKWGQEVNGNAWRTTGDITDSWTSLSDIGFNQDKLYPYARPGNWNDPDMLTVGLVGWGDNLHQTHLTPDEQYTHISLWCLLSAPLLIGCDMSKLDEFTLSLLTNDEVIAVDQDILGKQAERKVKTAAYQIWVKQLEDGSHAIGIFNLTTQYLPVRADFKTLGLSSKLKVRDLWRQKDLGTFNDKMNTNVPPHGVVFLKVN